VDELGIKKEALPKIYSFTTPKSKQVVCLPNFMKLEILNRKIIPTNWTNKHFT